MSIIYNQADFLNKNLPTTFMSSYYMDLFFSNVSTYVNNNVSDVNDINNNMLISLDETASLYKDTMRTLSSITNSIADIFITGGGSRDSIDIFNKILNTVSDGVVIDYDTMQLYLERTQLINYSLKNITLNTKNGTLGNTVEEKKKYFDINNIVSIDSRLEIESYESELDVDINIDLGMKSAFNNVRFKLANYGVRLPSVGSISISEDGCTYNDIKIYTSNEFSMDINDFDFKNGEINIHIEENSARYIRINLIQKMPYNTGVSKRKRYAIGMNKLEIAFYSAVESGSISIGPIKTSDEIFKIAAYGSMSRYDTSEPNVNLSVSTDLETWIPFQNSAVYDPESELSKIVNFNNIDSSSVFTDDIVTKFYLKIEMTSVDASYISPASRQVSRQVINANTSNRSFPISSVDGSDYLNLFKYTEVRYGDRILVPAAGGSLYTVPVENISSIEDSGISLTQGIDVESSKIYDLQKNIYDNKDRHSVIQFKYDKVHVTRNDIIENIPSDDFDPFAIELYGISSVINIPMNIETINEKYSKKGIIPVIPFIENAGVYTLRYNNKSIRIKYNSKFFYDVRETLYAVPTDVESVLVEDELGKRIATISPFLIGEINYISILDALGLDMPLESNGVKLNTRYPIEELAKDEYTIVFGELIFGSYHKSVFPVVRVLESEIVTRLDNKIDGVKLVSDSSKQIKESYEMSNSDLETVIKLKHTNILEQSVSFDMTRAAINAFINEVNFIDGQSEFVLSEVYIQTDNINLNKMYLLDEYLEDGSLEFRSCDKVFQRRVYAEIELVDMGDYLVTKEEDPVTHIIKNVVKLPEGIYTSSSNDTEIKYNVKPLKKSVSGFYSIDYNRGILYTTSSIDGKTSISYKYSSVYAKYPSMEKIPDNKYTVSSSNLTIDTEDEKTSKYLLVSSSIEQQDTDFVETPILLDFKLNTVDASNSI
ncbi:MAG: hypothetical protein DRQ78_00745 [Epsilonproteobacteria bacterium]|nr:MAG: hypothetical protein DRQ78_00745 [Campylobacterota bacterium]